MESAASPAANRLRLVLRAPSRAPGRILVAREDLLFGSEGWFCHTVPGEFPWRKDLGRMDVGAYDPPSYEWGGASSPIIHDGKVIGQCDQ